MEVKFISFPNGIGVSYREDSPSRGIWEKKGKSWTEVSSNRIPDKDFPGFLEIIEGLPYGFFSKEEEYWHVPI